MLAYIKRLIYPKGKYQYLHLKSNAGETAKVFRDRSDVLFRRIQSKSKRDIMSHDEYMSIPRIDDAVMKSATIGDKFRTTADDIGIFGVSVRKHDPALPNMKWELLIYRLEEPTNPNL